MEAIDIIRIAVAEHKDDDEQAQLILEASKRDVPEFSSDSPSLSVVRFTCMLQDTSYQSEVFQSPSGRLEERWVGWAVELPKSSRVGIVPEKQSNKFPPGSYLGALVKIYGDASHKPGSIHTFLGVVSTAPLPETEDWVPAIHVLSTVPQPRSAIAASRSELIGHLEKLCRDPTAATLLLLLLISTPARVSGGVLGTLSVNFFTEDSQLLQSSLDPFLPVVLLPLSLDVLHSSTFWPKSDSTSLDAGTLQLADGSLLVVDERQLQQGHLAEQAMKNLQVLSDCITEQKLRYEYPYMNDLKLDCDLKTLIVSDAKSLLPTDVRISVNLHPIEPPNEEMIAYIQQARHNFAIPEPVSQIIQESFVELRREQPRSAEEILKRRMKLGRLMALSYDGVLTAEIWEETVQIDRACS